MHPNPESGGNFNLWNCGFDLTQGFGHLDPENIRQDIPHCFLSYLKMSV